MPPFLWLPENDIQYQPDCFPEITRQTDTMPCQSPNPIEHSSRIKRWGAQLEKHRTLLTLKSLLFTTLFFIVSGYGTVAYLLSHPHARASRAVPVIQIGCACLIFITLYFVIVDYLLRNRPRGIRLIQRFIWYLAIFFIVATCFLGALVIA